MDNRREPQPHDPIAEEHDRCALRLWYEHTETKHGHALAQVSVYGPEGDLLFVQETRIQNDVLYASEDRTQEALISRAIELARQRIDEGRKIHGKVYRQILGDLGGKVIADQERDL